MQLKRNKENVYVLATPSTCKEPTHHAALQKSLIRIKKKPFVVKSLRTPANFKKEKAILGNSIKISKLKLRRENSLEKRFGFVNASDAFAPEDVFKLFPVKFNQNAQFEETCAPTRKIHEFLRKHQYLRRRLHPRKFTEFINVIFRREHSELARFSNQFAFTLFELFQELSSSNSFEPCTFVNGFAFLTGCLSKRLKERQAVFDTDRALEIYIEGLEEVNVLCNCRVFYAAMGTSLLCCFHARTIFALPCTTLPTY